ISDAGLTGIDLERPAFGIWNGKQTFSLGGLQGLQLRFGYFKVTDPRPRNLLQACRAARNQPVALALTWITDEGIEAMVPNCPSPEVMDLSGCLTRRSHRTHRQTSDQVEGFELLPGSPLLTAEKYLRDFGGTRLPNTSIRRVPATGHDHAAGES
ncbi:hypothetical protein pipiens_017035, partial [Culex pipiens pipiens]